MMENGTLISPRELKKSLFIPVASFSISVRKEKEQLYFTDPFLRSLTHRTFVYEISAGHQIPC